jgi:large subunit ribosomal protein L3
MLHGLIGRKVGMTQLFDEGGNAVPVTVIQAGPCLVVQKKTPEKEGYSAVQLGFVESKKTRANKPRQGHFKKAGVPPTGMLKEFAFSETDESQVNVGDQVQVHNVFQPNDRVDITGTAKGRGFQGVIKRHGFSGGKATHGSMFHRAPGSIGASAYPSRVYPGMKGAGRMGNKQVTIRNLQVVLVDEEKNLLAVQGGVPGSRGSIVYITRAGAPGKVPEAAQQADQDNA